MVAKADQTRVKDLITETITLLCKNGLHFRSEFSIQALIGITLDKNEVFLVNIDETIVANDRPNTTSKDEVVLIGIDEESDYESRCNSSKFHENTKKCDRTRRRQRTDCVYSAADDNNSWQDTNFRSDSRYDSESEQFVDAVKTTYNSSTSFQKSQKNNQMTSLQPAQVTAKENNEEQEQQGACSMDNGSVMDIQNMGDHVLNDNISSGLGNNFSHNIKEEPNEDGLVNFQTYPGPGFVNYNVSKLIQNQLIPDHRVVDVSAQHHHQLSQQELFDGSASQFQPKSTTVKSGGRGGILTFRRRSLGGPVYRMPRNHICNMCGKAFEKKRDLRGHLAAKHQMQKEHKCDICGKEFSYKRSLTDHLFVHTRPVVTSELR